MLTIIAAVADNGVIGNGNSLIWHISEDLRFFKKTTSGHAVIMGRKTYESIGRPLPNRRNIVVSRSARTPVEGIEWAASLEDAYQMTRNEEAFVIGGGEIYRQAIDLAERLILTEVHFPFEGDCYFPALDKNRWKEVSREDFARGEKFEHPFSFTVYHRIHE